MPPSNRTDSGRVLIVDDAPGNLSLLSDALDEAGYMVLVATDGNSALQRLRHVVPDVILLDALMPGMDGFETCQRIKARPETRDIPVIFMTGLTESVHVVRGFEVGGIDYVTKPIRPDEVLARVAAHVGNARLMRQARKVIEAAGLAIVVLNADLTPAWLTPEADALLRNGAPSTGMPLLPAHMHAWILNAAAGGTPGTCAFEHGGTTLDARLLGRTGGQSLLLLQKCTGPAPAPSPLASFRLTGREIEVLMWVAKGKTNKDIADILGMRPRTVNKHLEHIYVKLGVETRTAAAALVAGTTARTDS